LLHQKAPGKLALRAQSQHGKPHLNLPQMQVRPSWLLSKPHGTDAARARRMPRGLRPLPPAAVCRNHPCESHSGI